MIVDGTIVAQASAQGSAARGIIRISGDESLDAVLPFFSPKAPQNNLSTSEIVPTLSKDTTRPQITCGMFRPWGNETPFRQVKVILFYWPSGRGFTGEQAVELHLPGSSSILNASIRTLCSTGKVRLANRGEFTLRAFLNGRLDLTQAEAILGAIDATSDNDLNNALKQLSGTLSRKFSDLRDLLLNVLSEMEAGFDFIDEDIEFISFSQAHEKLEHALEEIEETLQASSTRLSRNPAPRVVLVGRPNVGKSSLFNALIDKFDGKASGKALVSGVAGTTRDYLEAELLIDGVQFTLVDTAGFEKEVLSASGDIHEPPVSQRNAPSMPSHRELAQGALRKALNGASLVVCCFDSAKSRTKLEEEIEGLSVQARIDVFTKQDLKNAGSPERANTDVSTIETSATANKGIEKLGKQIAVKLCSVNENSDIVPSTALRCQEALRNAKQSLQNALNLLENEALCDESLVASELRLALNQIGLITGQVHTDDLLDRIFSRFCIGK